MGRSFGMDLTRRTTQDQYECVDFALSNRMSNSGSKEKKVVATQGGSRWAQCAILGAVCALVIGIYAWSANSGMFELLGSGAKDSYYNLLVQGFRDGHLNLKTEVPPDLAQPGHDDIWLDIHGVHDLSYYKGKLYLYFGVTPAVVLFWPYAALTGHYLPHKDAVVIFFSVGFLAGAGLLWAVWRRYFAETGVWAVAAGILALGLANFAPAILGRSDVYEVAVSCGYALTMLALGGIWCALHDERRRWRWLAVASLAYGLALGSRPSLLFGAVILLVPVVQGWREKRTVWPLLLAATGPIVLIGLGLMAYNAARFDNPLEFGEYYMVPNAVSQGWSPRFLWVNFRVGFLALARWSSSFPFVHDIAAPGQPKGYYGVEHPFGVLSNIPLVWLALAAPLAWSSRTPEARSILRCFLGAAALLFGMVALTLCCYDAMCLRYEVEFTAWLVLLAVIGALALERGLAGRPAWRRASRCGWGLLLTFSVAFNLVASREMQADNRTQFANALLRMGRVDDAIAQFQEAMHIQPAFMQAHFCLGNVLMQQVKVDEAITQYQKAVQIEPDFALARNNLGSALLQKGRVDEAIALFQKALQLKTNYPEADYCLGNALLQKGRVDEAIAYYQKALQLNPDFALAQNSFGNALLQTGRVDEAIAHFQKAVEIEPNAAVAHYSLGAALVRIGRVDEAIIHFQDAAKILPNFLPAHIDLGNIFQQTGRLDEAITQYQEALQLNPGDPSTQINLAWLLATAPQASLRNGVKAVELARQASLLTGGGNPTVLRTLAAACAEAGLFSEAVETAQHALRVAEAQSNSALVGALESELKFYQAGSPLHGPDQPH